MLCTKFIVKIYDFQPYNINHFVKSDNVVDYKILNPASNKDQLVSYSDDEYNHHEWDVIDFIAIVIIKKI